MARRVAMLMSFVFLIVVVAVGWFGYAAYQRIGSNRAADVRDTAVASAWDMSSASLKAAAGGVGGVVPKSLAKSTWDQWNSLPVAAYSGGRNDGMTTLTYAASSCEWGEVWVTTQESVNVVVVILHRVSSLNPLDVVKEFIPGRTCTAEVTLKTMKVQLPSPIGSRVVVDGVTGMSVQRK